MTAGRRSVAALLLVVGSLAACTVPNNDDPVELSGTVPFGLLETTTTTTTTTVPAVSSTERIVWFLDTSEGGNRLVPVPRNLEVGADVQEILSNLFTVRPDGAERPAEAGLTSAIPESAQLLSAQRNPDSTRIIIDVRGLFGEGGITGQPLRNALAQIVYTATQDETISEVSFQNNGTPVQAFVDGGEIAEGPVNRNDYDQG